MSGPRLVFETFAPEPNGEIPRAAHQGPRTRAILNFSLILL
jgi:hypothetical protein